MIVRAAKDDEVATNVALYNDAYPRDAVRLAEVDGSPVGSGLAVLQETDPGVALTLIVVRAESRRQVRRARRRGGRRVREAPACGRAARGRAPWPHWREARLRRRGIAAALKRAQIAWAAEAGYQRLVSASRSETSRSGD
ncbi:MAG TPA: hypothetical protein VF101_11355 [Gaiellaceae bacterium]